MSEDNGKKEDPKHAMPEITFSTFIMSLGTATMIHLGIMPDPISKKTETNNEMAKQNIDLIALLKEKTKGNLSEEEQSLVDGMLYDLRMKYVESTK